MKFLDKFRKRLEEKAVQYISSYHYGMPKWSTQKDEEYITEAFNKIIWVYACVDKIATCVSSVPFTLYRMRNGNKIEIEQHPILDLVNCKASPYQTSTDFFEMWATYLAIQGKFYAVMNNTNIPTQLEYLYPHKVKVIPNKQDIVQGFEYDINGETTRYKAEEILWDKFNDPLSFYEGLSPIRAMARTIDTENSTINWNKNSMDNNAVPAGIIQVTNPSPELQQRLKSEWIKRYSGSGNAKVPLVLDSEKASYQSLGFSPIDMDFINQRKLSRIEICAGFGVPSQIVGDPEGQTYANYAEAIKSFWENTVIPKYLDKIVESLNLNIVAKYAGNLKLEANLDGIEALHESIDAISTRTTELWQKGLITRNEGRYALGYEEKKGEDIFIDAVKARQFASLTNTEPEKEQEDEGEEEPKKDDVKKKALNMNKDQIVQYWKRFENEREQFYRLGIRDLKNFFKSQKDRINNIIAIDEKDLTKKATAIVDEDKKKLQKLLINLFIKTMTFFGEKTERELFTRKSIDNIEKKFDVFDDELTKWIVANVAEDVTRINRTTKDQIKNIVLLGQEQGSSIQEISESIDKLYLEQIIPNRSETIARTEVISSSNQASLSSAQQTGLPIRKIWIPTQDDRTRDTHAEMINHPPIELDENFMVGDSEMQAPADPNGEAKERVNCRCSLGYVSAEGEEIE